MRSKVLILAVIFCAASGINSSAEERKVSGEISLTAQHLNIEGNEAKLMSIGISGTVSMAT